MCITIDQVSGQMKFKQNNARKPSDLSSLKYLSWRKIRHPRHLSNMNTSKESLTCLRYARELTRVLDTLEGFRDRNSRSMLQCHVHPDYIWAGLWKVPSPELATLPQHPNFSPHKRDLLQFQLISTWKNAVEPYRLTSQHQEINLPILRTTFCSNPSSHNSQLPKFAKHLRHPLTPLIHPAISQAFPPSTLRPTSFSKSSCW